MCPQATLAEIGWHQARDNRFEERLPVLRLDHSAMRAQARHRITVELSAEVESLGGLAWTAAWRLSLLPLAPTDPRGRIGQTEERAADNIPVAVGLNGEQREDRRLPGSGSQRLEAVDLGAVASVVRLPGLRVRRGHQRCRPCRRARSLARPQARRSHRRSGSSAKERCCGLTTASVRLRLLRLTSRRRRP